MSKQEQDEVMEDIPAPLWARIKARCDDKDMTMLEGFIEMATDWLGKD